MKITPSLILFTSAVLLLSACKKSTEDAAASGPSNTLAVTTFAGSTQGSTNGTGTAAKFSSPYGIASDQSGNFYVADAGNSLIRKITPAGVVTTLAGSGTQNSIDGTGTAASFFFPSGIVVDASGNVYVSDTGKHNIRKITPAGVVTTIAGTGSVGSANGTGTAASFNYPQALTLDASGNLYVADEGNSVIRKITPEGVVSTFAGTMSSYGAVDGTGTAAKFYGPCGITIDASGNFYVSDKSSYLIRKITPAGVVTTLAGSASNIGSADGTGSVARFRFPRGLAVDHSGNVYVADSGNNIIRKITPAGVVTTVVGSGIAGSTNAIGTAAQLDNPYDLVIDASGHMYITDTGSDLVRRVD